MSLTKHECQSSMKEMIQRDHKIINSIIWGKKNKMIKGNQEYNVKDKYSWKGKRIWFYLNEGRSWVTISRISTFECSRESDPDGQEYLMAEATINWSWEEKIRIHIRDSRGLGNMTLAIIDNWRTRLNSQSIEDDWIDSPNKWKKQWKKG